MEKKLLELKFLERKVALWRVAAAVAFRKNFKLNLRKVKLTFTACSLTEFIVLQKEHLWQTLKMPSQEDFKHG